MNRKVSDIAFSESVKKIQDRKSPRPAYAGPGSNTGWEKEIDASLAEFIASRDSMYIATANAQGQPYTQHRGGPPGFIKVLDTDTLGFADFVGNQQYITQGNLAENDQAFLFLMDYSLRRRVKIWGRAQMIEDDEELIAKLSPAEQKSPLNAAVIFKVDAWSVNCPNNIPERYSKADVLEITDPLYARIAELEEKMRVLGVNTDEDS